MTAPGHPALFDYPDRARLGRVVPKNRIVVSGKPGRRVSDQLTAQVARIVWQYKLAPETINLRGSPAVPEIQVFSLILKPAGVGDELPVDVLRSIDRAIAFPLIFELITTGEDDVASAKLRVAATYKRPSEANASKWVIDEYFATDWLPLDAARTSLPVALDLPRLYEQMLHQLIPTPPRPGESVAALVERQGRIAVLQRECRRLEARIHRAEQFNRKVEFNRQLREMKANLDTLIESSNEGQRQDG